MTIIDTADLFCGAGGTSTGLLQAAKKLNKKIRLVAVNHWELAISTHSQNHPGVNHHNSDLKDIDPKKVVPSGRLRLLVASPECTHFSKARGGKPMSKQSRASIKYVLRWIGALDVEDVLVENVPDFMSWGPLYRTCTCGMGIKVQSMKHDKSCHFEKPIQNRKGEYFHRFINKLKALGYNVGYRVLTAADYGDPTTRQRLFIIARKNKPVMWPEPSHNKDGGDMFGKLPRWRSAREIIDWDMKGDSIYTRKTPLSPNTMRRIKAGIMKFGGGAFVIGQQSGAAPRSVEDPIPTVAGAGKISFIEPFLVEYHGGDKAENRTRSIDQPMPTLDTSNRFGLVQPFLLTTNWQETNRSPARSLDEPFPTVTGHANIGLVEPFIIPFFGERQGQTPRTHSIDEPLQTITSQGAGALVEPFIIQMDQGGHLRDIDKPMPTLTSADGFALVDPFLVEFYGTGGAASVEEPMKTLTGKDRFGLVEPMAIEQDGKRYILDIRFRMLQPHELARAMSFPKKYKFKGTREQVVKQIGNSVPVSTAEALCVTLLQ